MFPPRTGRVGGFFMPPVHDDVLWYLLPNPSILDAFRLNWYTSASATLSILTFVANLILLALRARSKKSAGTDNGGRVRLVVLTLVFLLATAFTAFQLRQIAGTREVHYRLTSKAFRVALDDRVVKAVIDSTGGAIVATRMRVRASNPKQAVDQFELRYRIPDYPGTDGAEKMSTKQLEVRSDKGKIHFKSAPSGEANSFRVIANISPAVPPDSSVTLQEALVTRAPPAAFAMTEQASIDRKKDSHQYFTFELRYPCNRLTISVVFPEGFEPSGRHFVAWYGEAQVPHQGELDFMTRHYGEVFQEKIDLTTKQLEVTLDLPYPLLGIHYGIGWIPPTSWN